MSERSTDKIIDRVLWGVDVPIINTEGKFLMLHRDVVGEDFDGWEYVKGGLKEGESFTDAAWRECSEEAAGIGLELLAELPEEYNIDVRHRQKELYDYVMKKVVVMLAHTHDIEQLSENEHKAYQWMSYEEAREKIWVEDGKEILDKAQEVFDKYLLSQNESATN